MNLVEKFAETIRAGFPGNGHRFLLAVSGGMDSSVLCALCSQAKLSFSIAHCNFQLRGEESDRDESFVRELARQYGLEVIVRRFETAPFASAQKLSIQEAARELRYQWFHQLREERNSSAILLAHHADDNIETIVMNFFRGTGLRGLTGIPLRNGNICRPMLSFRRSDIFAFAHEQKIGWVEDSSNAASDYTRNYLRNEVLPSLAKAYPRVDENLLDNIGRFSMIHSFYEEAVKKQKEALCEIHGEEVRIPVRKLRKYNVPVLLYEIVRDFGFGEKAVAEVVKLMSSGSGKFIANEKYQIIRHGLWLIITPRGEKGETIAIGRNDSRISFSNGHLAISYSEGQPPPVDPSPCIAQLDAARIEFPLTLRRWNPGDYFYPLGLRKKKKLARFFIDQKLAKHQKENVWVLESGSHILWVVGMRIDDRFRITPSTQKVLSLTLQRESGR